MTCPGSKPAPCSIALSSISRKAVINRSRWSSGSADSHSVRNRVMRSALTRPQATRNVIHVGRPETTSMPRRQSSVRSAVAAMSATSRGSTGAVKQANTCARSAVTTSLSVSAGASRITRTPGRSRFSSSTSAMAPLTGRAESVTTTSAGRTRASWITSSAPRHVSTVWPSSTGDSRRALASPSSNPMTSTLPISSSTRRRPSRRSRS